MKKLVFPFIFFLLPEICPAQNGAYYFKTYQVQNGLSSNTITSILQDKKGFIWIGTRNGLNRFDGNSFKVFQNILSDSMSLGSNSIFSLFEDRKEELWIGTYNGIYIYNPMSECFRPFGLLEPGEVRFIAGDNKNNIWIISNFNLYKYSPGTNQITSYRLKNDQTIAMHVSKDGNIWTATSNGLVRHFDPITENFISYNVKTLHSKGKLSPIEDLYPIGDSALLIGCMNEVLLFNFKNST